MPNSLKLPFWTQLATAALLLLLSGCAMLNSPSFENVTLRELVQRSEFTPFVLYPEPDEVDLRVGPYYGAGRVEMHYTEPISAHPGASPPVFELYQSAKPLPEGVGALSNLEADDEGVISEQISLFVSAQEYTAKLRSDTNDAETGAVFLTIDRTHLIYYWRNVPQARALQVFSEHLTAVEPADEALIQAFDRDLMQRSVNVTPVR